MRDVALTLVFAGLVVLTLRGPWIGALLWTWFSLMNPHRLTYGFAYELPFALVAALATVFAILWARRGSVRLPPDPLVILLVIFVVWMCLTTMMALLPDPSQERLLRVVKIQIMTLLCIAVIRERKHIEAFIWVNVASLGFFGVKGGIFAIATGGSARVWGPADSFIQDNNALGLALVMIVPLGYYLLSVSPKRWLRVTMAIALLLCAAAILSTQSRGALLAISAMALLLWTRSRRKLPMGIALAVLAVVFVMFMPESWEQRMRTIGTYQQDDSAMQRINAWQAAINIANDRITGGGFAVDRRAVFDIYAPRPEWVHTAHSIYFQALGEHGWIGLALFLSLGAVSYWTTVKLRRQARERPETMWVHDLTGMIQVSMMGFAVGGAFLSLTYFDLPYNIMVMLIACKYWVLEERWKQETTGAFGALSTEAVAQLRRPRPPGPATP